MHRYCAMYNIGMLWNLELEKKLEKMLSNAVFVGPK